MKVGATLAEILWGVKPENLKVGGVDSGGTPKTDVVVEANVVSGGDKAPLKVMCQYAVNDGKSITCGHLYAGDFYKACLYCIITEGDACIEPNEDYTPRDFNKG